MFNDIKLSLNNLQIIIYQRKEMCSKILKKSFFLTAFLILSLCDDNKNIFCKYILLRSYLI